MPKIYCVGYLMVALEGQWDRIFNIWIILENWVVWLLKDSCILILKEQKRVEK